MQSTLIDHTESFPSELRELAGEIRDNLKLDYSDKLWSAALAAAFVLEKVAEKIETGTRPS